MAFVAVTAIGLGSMVLGVIGSWPQVIVRLSAGDAILLLTLFVVGAAAQGLPPGIARRIKFGFRSREWEFDRRFFQYKKQIDAALAAYPDPPTLEAYRAWKSRTIAVGDRVVKQMSKLKEPDEEWSSLRDDYVEAYTGILRRIAHDEEHDAAEIVRRGTELKERAEVLIRKYRIELDRLSRPRDEI
ncbi:MAG: hypothetical protein AABZ33_04905 [Chloroflexota bacterium]